MYQSKSEGDIKYEDINYRCSRFYWISSCEKLIIQGHQVIGIDSINDYYSVSLKEDRLKSIGKESFTFIN